MTNEEKKYWIGFSCVPGIGPKKFKTLLKYFGSAEKAWKGDLREVGFKEESIRNFNNFREKFDFSSYFLRLEKLGVNSLILEDKNYPESLKQLEDAPFVIYLLGEILPSDELAIGIVGTRKITGYGKQVTESLTADLVSNGLTIVSGLAYGVDYAAHSTALEMGGRTIGVWAGGLDTVNDGFRKSLVEKILKQKQGTIISEYPLGFEPRRTTFPQRNRIISGLSLGVLVTEAAEDSGSLITAKCAVEQGRKVFAVPGPITSSLSAGTAKLLKEKAILVYNVKDILDEINIAVREKGLAAREILPENENEEKILASLKNENRNIDEIAKITRIEISQLSGIMAILELKGIVVNLGGSVFGLGR
ncbi:DNA-protecting protein DprA [Candidatus Shapirobacteria bacterium CG08_land_8_20_14_0_20_39_18]|uniref:DNA-protecting protein DprA n=1 Tax=Candidatus Shapirobacteria bacterium CG08_land_8_20_14_0_20_39_18 TaxID=1974883 RepID=A0A2M6XDA0_9BACT|nr:MAG: DNA-protecting protein DprA [Candidatus Shapirobacteria bacterium CG08_land_8_20_14_0_20_39_18]PIY66028.1 MAG: DNA-protecting protein DprA [Candidatus Shapirobacteria bacterium CG_4_10_14_0_8_um_filter_39_15]PJE68175.1 MAG: DNA-protecting protein DprA [Candidatus Shapirobacteria bacterium CG10_big_fil_rev_8_21_14_0_10_38_8]